MAHLALTAGPDAGRFIDLEALETMGRAPATLGRRGAIAIDDPALEVVHASIDTSSGVVRRLGGEVHRGRGGDQRVGSTTLRTVGELALVERSRSPLVERPVRIRHIGPESPVDGETSLSPLPPHPRPGAGLPVAAVIGLVASGVIAIITRNPMFLLFGSIGAMTALGTSAVELVRSRRAQRQRAGEEASSRARAAERTLESHRARARVLQHIWPLDLVAVARSARLWERRPDHGDLLRVVIGLEVDAHPGVAEVAEATPDVPVVVDLAMTPVVAVIATDSVAEAVLRSIACQLAIAVGPADVIIDIRYPLEIPLDPPHRLGPVGSRHRVMIGVEASELGDPMSATRRLLDGGEAVTVITVVRPGDAVPAGVTSTLAVDDDWSGRWTVEAARPEISRPLSAAIGASARTAGRIARELAGLTDPELAGARRAHPWKASLDEVLDPSPCVDDGDRLEMALGCDADGNAVLIDLVTSGPHVLLAGTTGSGKSELLRTMVVTAAIRQSPERLNIALIDFKGGTAFDSLAGLPHIAATLTDLDESSTERAIIGLDAELRWRERALRGHRGIGSLPFPRLLIVIDEFAELLAADPSVSQAMLGIARRGRGLGVHLIIATQRPAGVVNEEIRANTDVRICLRVNSAIDSRDVIGDDSAASIDRSTPGRGVVRVAGREHRAFQAALVGSDHLAGARRPSPGFEIRPPWRPALPVRLEPALPPAGGDLGVVDRPESQSTQRLCWEPGEGSLIISGDPGTGRTSALRTVVASIDCPTHLVADRLDSTVAPIGTHVARPIRVDDTERVQRLLRRLDGALRSRRSGSEAEPVLLAVDGLDRLITDLERLGDDESVDRLRSLIADGPSLGISMVATTRSLHRLVDLPVTHWLLARGDPGPAQQLGAPTALMPNRIPGRILRLPDPAVAQIRLPPARTVVTGSPPPDPIEVLPSRTNAARPTGAEVDGGIHMEIGIAAEDLSPLDITLFAGRHMLVIGGRRSGRTATLEWIARSWTAITGDRPVTVRRSLDEASGVGSGLVIVDDALRVDAGGDADRLLGDSNVVVVAAVDGDGLRGAWGHWVGDLRRWRTGIVMASGAALDGDLLGAALPARTPIAARPGLGWWVADGRRELLQLHEGRALTPLHPDPTVPDDMLAPWRTRTVPPSRHSICSDSTAASLS